LAAYRNVLRTSSSEYATSLVGAEKDEI